MKLKGVAAMTAIFSAVGVLAGWILLGGLAFDNGLPEVAIAMWAVPFVALFVLGAWMFSQ